jgi:hypothetical protein
MRNSIAAAIVLSFVLPLSAMAQQSEPPRPSTSMVGQLAQALATSLDREAVLQAQVADLTAKLAAKAKDTPPDAK